MFFYSTFLGFLTGLLLNACLSLQAQPVPAAPSNGAAVETLLESTAETAGLLPSQKLQELIDLALNPLNLNTTSATDLSQIPGLSSRLAYRITAFRKRFGLFANVAELRAVKGISQELLETVDPYLTAKTVDQPSKASTDTPSPAASSLRGDLIQRVGRRVEQGRGYSKPSGAPSAYRGSPYRLTTRLCLRYNQSVTANLTLDKDPGEPLGWNQSTHTYGTDFWSAHLAVRRKNGFLRHIVLGDFSPAFGQGLAFGQGRGFGKSRRTTRSIIKQSRGLSPYRSTSENRFFRGLALSLQPRTRLQFSAFASRRTLDAVPTPAEQPRPQQTISGLFTGGYHRTLTELQRKDRLGETVTGGALEWKTAAGRLGVTGYYSWFDHRWSSATQPYQRFNFSGHHTHMVSLYSDVVTGPGHWFAEGARAANGSLAALGGVSAQLAQTIEVLLLARHVPKEFISLYGGTFGEGQGAPSNESGLYTGIRIKPFSRGYVAAYFDQFWYPWLRYSASRPSSGQDALLFATYRPQESIKLYLQFRDKRQAKNAKYSDRTGLIYGLGQFIRQTVRFHGSYQMLPNLRLRARLEFSRAAVPQQPTQQGTLFYQDIRWQLFERLQLDGRITIFDTAGYAARLYAYENDLLYAFSLPAFFGQGQRAYLLLNWQPQQALTLQAKYAVVRYYGRDSVGSGLNQTPGNRLRELRLQIRWQW